MNKRMPTQLAKILRLIEQRLDLDQPGGEQLLTVTEAAKLARMRVASARRILRASDAPLVFRRMRGGRQGFYVNKADALRVLTGA